MSIRRQILALPVVTGMILTGFAMPAFAGDETSSVAEASPTFMTSVVQAVAEVFLPSEAFALPITMSPPATPETWTCASGAISEPAGHSAPATTFDPVTGAETTYMGTSAIVATPGYTTTPSVACFIRQVIPKETWTCPSGSTSGSTAPATTFNSVTGAETTYMQTSAIVATQGYTTTPSFECFISQIIPKALESCPVGYTSYALNAVLPTLPLGWIWTAAQVIETGGYTHPPATKCEQRMQVMNDNTCDPHMKDGNAICTRTASGQIRGVTNYTDTTTSCKIAPGGANAPLCTFTCIADATNAARGAQYGKWSYTSGGNGCSAFLNP